MSWSDLPSLSGTQKQVDWAEKIRKDTLSEIATYAQTRNSDGRPSRCASILGQGKKAMMDDINNNPLIRSTTGALRQQKINNAVNGFRDAARRIEVVKKIAMHDSAKYWIDNRPNSLNNHLLKRWKAMVDGK